jgi:hypothetical protein
MARRITSLTSIANLQPFADTTGMTNNQYPHLIQGGSATQVVNIWEVSISGQAPSASSPCIMLLSYDSTVGATAGARVAGNTDVAMNPATAALALPALTVTAWTTTPQRNTAAHLANMSLNAFGGAYFWRANKTEECFQVLGNSTVNGEISLSAFTGSTAAALLGSHIIYEPL